MKQHAKKTSILIARGLIAVVLIWTAAWHLTHFAETTLWITKHPPWLVRLAIGSEKLMLLRITQGVALGTMLTGGVALLVGFHTRRVAIGLIVLLVALMLSLSDFAAGSVGSFQGQALGLIGGLLLILVQDPGPPILTKRKRR